MPLSSNNMYTYTHLPECRCLSWLSSMKKLRRVRSSRTWLDQWLQWGLPSRTLLRSESPTMFGIRMSVGVAGHNWSVAGKFKRACVYNVHGICLFSLEEYGNNVHVLTLRERGREWEREREGGSLYNFHEYIFFMLLPYYAVGLVGTITWCIHVHSKFRPQSFVHMY